MKRWPFWTALLSALLGIIILWLWFGKFWPLSGSAVLSRPQLIAKGREVASQFGLNVNGWHAYVVAEASKALAQSGQGRPLLSVRITYLTAEDKRAAEVGFDSAGLLKYWRPPSEYRPARPFESAEAAAQSAFHLMAGAQAANYRPPTNFSGDEEKEREFEFKKIPTPKSDLRESIKVTTKGSAVERVERKVTNSYSDEDDDEHSGYWGLLSGLFGLIFTIGTVVAVSIFVLWLARKALNRRFQLRFAGAAFVLMLVVMWGGSDWDKTRSVNREHDTPAVPQLFVALGILVYVAVGRGISVENRAKWMSLEQLCLLAPIAKPTGESLAAGLLFSPLLASLPFLIVGGRLFPNSWILPQQAETIYSRAPLLDSLPISACVGLLFFFGFLLPALTRLIRFRWLRWLIVLPIGTVFFANLTRVVSGPVAVPLTAGLLTLALFWFVWAQFDVLAVLTLQLASALVLGLLVLAQQGHNPAAFIVALACLLVAAFWCYRRGQPMAEGDPLATTPMVTGFRAEREKLLADFSIARRAQQDMLPQFPPDIPGYSIAASCTPSLEVGGDLYDFLKLRDGRIGIGVADVSGKGVPAALYMTLTKGLLSEVTKDSSEIGPVVEEVNRHLHGVTRKRVFVTMALGFLDAEKRVLQCVRAGHNPVVWRQKGRGLTTLVAPSGLGLGITASQVFSTQLKVEHLELADGDAVVFYSDGITEAMNRGLEQFGEQRLMDAVDRTDSLDATASRDSILSEVREFLDGVHPQDDMTLVVLRVGEHK